MQFEVIYEYHENGDRKELKSVVTAKSPDAALHMFRENMVRGMVEKGKGEEEASDSFDETFRLRRVAPVGAKKS